MNAFGWFRVDDRLIHGQVMVGWVFPLGIKRLIVANDELAGDDFQKDIVTQSAQAFSDDVRVSVVSLSDALSRLMRKASSPSMLLTESLKDALFLIGSGLETEKLNLGGIHAGQDRRRLLAFLYLSHDEMDAVIELAESGIKVVAQELPDSRAYDVAELIRRWRA